MSWIPVSKTADSCRKTIQGGAVRIALIYAVIGVVYIVVSDRVVGLLFSDVSIITWVSTLKGWAFIGITALLLWFLIRRHSAHLLASEAKRLEREAMLSNLIDGVGGYIYVKDAQYRYLYGNAAVCKLFGVTAEQLVGCEDTRFLDAETAAGLRANDRRVIEDGERIEDEEEHVSTGSGTRRIYLSVKMPLRRPDGSIYGLCGISTDITDRKAEETARLQLQAQLVQAQKLQTIGQLTGGIAHDFNNILASVLGFASLAQQRAQSFNDAQLMDDLSQIQRAGERASALVMKLLQFSRTTPTEGVAPPLLLRPAIADILKMLRPTIPASIAIHTALDEAVSVNIDPVELQQALTNLIINARDAIEGSGEITVAVRRRNNPHSLICSSCRASLPDHCIELSVSDTGRGIEAESLSEVFEPFYTTKEVGKGAGLGLSVVHGIMHKLGGHILITSRPHGATISLLWPQTENPLLAPGSAPELLRTCAPAAHSTGRGTVMVIDDEPALVRMLSVILSGQGYSVMDFVDSRAALQAFSAGSDAVDLVISDQTMPGMTGMELARHMRAHRPDLPFLLCSGYIEYLGEAGPADVTRVFAKPVDMQELLRVIAGTLGADRRDGPAV